MKMRSENTVPTEASIPTRLRSSDLGYLSTYLPRQVHGYLLGCQLELVTPICTAPPNQERPLESRWEWAERWGRSRMQFATARRESHSAKVPSASSRLQLSSLAIVC